MAENVNKELEQVGYRNINVVERPDLAVLRRTRMPAILVEAGFINSDVDNNLFDTKFSETAEAIARGIDETIRDAGYTVAQGDMRSDVAQVSAPVSEEMYIAKSENDASGTFGWENNWRADGTMSGTSGKAKRLEAIQIRLGRNINGGVRYKTHVQTFGWQNWVSNGTTSGTSGLGKRLEAIQIELTGQAAQQYDIYYRVHVQSYGWLDWAKNGQMSGTSGLAKRLEGIQIVLVPKGAAAPGKTARACINR